MVKEELGLRERKKLRTKNALVDAALELFFSKGFEATTVEEIAAAVEISPRTFFRYFAGKEDVALSQFAELDEFCIAALAQRPADEPPVAATRTAYLAMFDHIAAFDGGPARYSATHRLISQTPTLFARWLSTSAVSERRLAEVIATRQGVSAAEDIRCRLLIRVLCASARLGMEVACQRGYSTLDELRAQVIESMDLGIAGLPAAWSSSGERW
ncbi:TetR family transcriptional regulator [Crossiella cryophila]|nr:TetR family transcriptional regulator [Crossiella cryophila]